MQPIGAKFFAPDYVVIKAQNKFVARMEAS